MLLAHTQHIHTRTYTYQHTHRNTHKSRVVCVNFNWSKKDEVINSKSEVNYTTLHYLHNPHWHWVLVNPLPGNELC